VTRPHFAFWPTRKPITLAVPDTTLSDNLEVTARRYPDRTAIIYYDQFITYRTLRDEVNRMATYLMHLGVNKGDRVLIYMQNSPQFIISYYAILRCGGVVVPINPMNLTDELSFYIQDGGIKISLVGQELYPRIERLLGTSCLERIIIAAYSDYCLNTCADAPEFVKAPRQEVTSPQVIPWAQAMRADIETLPFPEETGSELAVLPYTSGTTGEPKGCMHTHKSVQANVMSAAIWGDLTSETNVLCTLPLFHVTGMVHSMHAPIYMGAAMVIMTRWDRHTAARFIETHKCTHWTGISTMIVDFLSNPQLAQYDLSSLLVINGGGAGLPEAVGEKLYQVIGLRFVEGYGLSETMAQTHFNPLDRPKLQCIGVPSFDVDARIIDPISLEEMGPREEGEIMVNGPQLFQGYWNNPVETKNAFVEIDGKPFFRSGDIGYCDEEGYFFVVERVKRMINASGFKVWPSEVESILYKHPAIKEACVIGVPDKRKGEEIKAYVVLQEDKRGTVEAGDIIRWAQQHMAAYKYPRLVELVTSLPVTGSGKILWRKLQEEARNKANQED
jgi:fatty-acyl-CoA synthase